MEGPAWSQADDAATRRSSEPTTPAAAAIPAAAPASAAAQSSERPKVIYVMGAGHSGSTILGLTLGNCEGVFFAGELARWLRWDGRSPLPGEERERFWRGVREQVDVPADLLGRRPRVLEQSSALFRPASWVAQRRLRNRYRRVTEALYQTIARSSGDSRIVDTSHFPRRARELQAIDSIDLYLLFVVRDAQSVVASYERKNVAHKQTWDMPTTNAYLWLTYVLSLAIFLRHPPQRRMFLRHETFIADPQRVLREILAWSGSTAATPDLGALKTGVPFQGNRLVRSDVVALNSRPEQPPKGSRATALLQLPWRPVFARLRPAVAEAHPPAG